MNRTETRTGRLNLIKYQVGRDGRYILYLGNKFIGTVDSYKEAVEEDQKLLEV